MENQEIAYLEARVAELTEELYRAKKAETEKQLEELKAKFIGKWIFNEDFCEGFRDRVAAFKIVDILQNGSDLEIQEERITITDDLYRRRISTHYHNLEGALNYLESLYDAATPEDTIKAEKLAEICTSKFDILLKEVLHSDLTN